MRIKEANDMKNKKLVIVGLGETVALAYEYFTHDSDYEVVAFAANRQYITQSFYYDLPLIELENIKEIYPSDQYQAFVAISSGHLNRDRMQVYDHMKILGYTLASYISSKAFI